MGGVGLCFVRMCMLSLLRSLATPLAFLHSTPTREKGKSNPFQLMDHPMTP